MIVPSFFQTICRFLFLALHLSASRTFPRPLSPEEEKRCFQRMEQGDTEAKSMLVEHNLRLVAHMVKKYANSFQDQEDLISIGTIGLIKAVSTFHYEKGVKFSSYASKCIENEILMYFRGKKKLVSEVYLDDPVDLDKEGNALTMMDLLADQSDLAEEIDQKIEAEQLREKIVSCLDDREQTVLILRFGLNGGRPLAQREVAQHLGISRSYVSRIEKKALEKLRTGLEE